MRGDFTRFSHQPGKHYAAVLMQQGRVALDADRNEEVDILDQRWRRQTIDTIGACGVPKHAPGFEISVTPDGTDLRIAKGRIYVDGILCELDTETRYLDQPDLPAPLPQPLEAVVGRTDLVFVDVWRRHITAIEDPNLREVALGGPDTTTRLQTVAQVKVLSDVGTIGCHDQADKWDSLTAPSAGRMSAHAKSVPDPDDPCLIRPGAGFRGLENRLYRVEVHTPGARGTATFVWSRDNGSVLASVDRFVSATQIQVGSLGRDQTLGFKKGDRVEVSSDLTELLGTHGTMAKVDHVDEVRRVLTLSENVSAHNHNGKFHPRVRRWDQPGDPIPIPTTDPWIPLEDGVEVCFTAGPFRPGDAWVIPARTATGQVEGFTDQPPRWTTHHYCRLALVTWAKAEDGTWSDTRVRRCATRFLPLTELPSGESCCDVTVGDETTTNADFADIQAAVDSLAGGGRVCILPGSYQLQDPVVIHADDLIIAGCDGRTQVIAPSGAPAFVVEECSRFRLAGLGVHADSPGATVQATRCDGLEVHDCELANTGDGGAALVVSDSTAVSVLDCRLAARRGLSLQAGRARVTGNQLSGGGIWLREGSADVLVEGNVIAGGPGPGVALGGLAPDERPSGRGAGVVRAAVVGNRIQQMEGSGVTTVAATGDEALADVRDLTIARNEIRSCAREPADALYEPQAVGGITLRNVALVRVHDNLVADNGAGTASACGIFVHTCRGLRVWGNKVTGNGTRAVEGSPTVYQGGIVALLVLGGIPPRSGQGEATGTGNDEPAATIHDNVVVSPAGQALLAVGLGPISVADNTLVAHDLARQPFELSRAGGAVFTLDVGRTPVLSDAAIGFGTAVGTSLGQCRLDGDALVSPAPRTGTPFPDGRVLFQGNQVCYRVPEMDVNPPSSAVVVVSTDDAALLDNQVLTEVGDGMIWAGVQAYAPTLRVAGNRFTETPCRAVFSCVTAGSAAIVADNQATHCVAVTGGQTVDRDNQILLAADCERITAALARGGT
jgi:hypothetical protein